MNAHRGGIYLSWRDIVFLAIGLAVGFFARGAFGQTPASELRHAVHNLQQSPPEVAPGIFYLTMYAVAPEQRQQFARVLNYTVNAVSRTGTLTNVKFISPTLVRVNIGNYAPRQSEFNEWRKALSKLAQFDSAFKIRTQALVKGKVVTTSVDGGWLNQSDVAQMKALTLSNAGIMRADYFVAAALTAPAYYELAGIANKEDDFLLSFGIDTKLIDAAHANIGANLNYSNVTEKPRRIIRLPGLFGGAYITYDVERVDAERDPIRRPIDTQNLKFKFDVTEIFAQGPNGLWYVALFNNKGQLQNSVPDKVAKDTSDPHGDGIVQAAFSCFRCHVEGGLRPFVDDQSKLMASFVSADPEIVDRMLAFYQPAKLQAFVAHDRKVYEAACKQVSGLSSNQLAEALGDVYRAYRYDPVTLAKAAHECGASVKQFRTANARTNDPIILLLLDNRVVLRDQFDSSLAEAALAVAGGVR